MTKEDQDKSNLKNNVALLMTVLSGIGSFGSLVINLTGVSALNENAILWFQGFAALTIFLAIIFIGMQWDLKRNKWHGIEDRYMQLDLLTSVTDPEYTPDIFYRMRIETLRKRKRLALSEGNKALAKQYQSEIDEAKELLEKLEQ